MYIWIGKFDLSLLIWVAINLLVYEETAGLMVNDPVLRTHKVRYSLDIIYIVNFLETKCDFLCHLCNLVLLINAATLCGAWTWNPRKHL